ncbi:MAG TPA: iron-sulfur cluster assembly scaffold protein [Thermomicrobiales bacterium]|nr:iron-sulfur cluster assembly scaffold protein [Thermomicrobiales bacterium]
MNTFYRENILDHNREPRHHGRLDRPTISREESNPLCGDVIHMDLLIEDGRLVDARFEGRGCAVSQAAASMLLEEVVGRDIEAVKAFGRDDLFALIGVPLTPARMKCALLSLGVLRDAVYGAVERRA